ncbi:MAG: DNA polymerase IV [Cyanobacteria bacterium J06627_15]
MTGLRKILHVDMDAFYASIEQRDHPEYQGKPLAVGGQPDKRGAVAAASYEAREFGVHSALPSRIARQRCPSLIFVKPRFEVYKTVSQQIRAIFLDYTDLVEPLSLDEAYLDVTENKLAIPRAVAIAQDIKQRIQQTTELTASAGVSINKFLAKTASGMNKPDGLTVILPEQASDFVAQLPIEKFHGIGPATATKMKQLEIHRGEELRAWSEADLVARFGKVGRYYYRIARGQDDRPVNPNRIRKSIGSEHSFAEDLTSLTQMRKALVTLAEEVQTRLQKAQRVGYTLTLKVKYANYQQITRSRTVAYPLQTRSDLLPLAETLLTHHVDKGRQVRLLGLTVANLAAASEPMQLPLPGL